MALHHANGLRAWIYGRSSRQTGILHESADNQNGELAYGGRMEKGTMECKEHDNERSIHAVVLRMCLSLSFARFLSCH